jgi:hypothetical protein
MVTITSTEGLKHEYEVLFNDELDSVSSFKSRLAAQVGNTLPEYLYISPDKKYFTDLIDFVKLHPGKSFDFLKKKWYGADVQSQLPVDELAKVFLTYVKFQPDTPAYRVGLADSVGDALANASTFIQENSVQIKGEEGSSFHRLIKQKIRENHKNVDKDTLVVNRIGEADEVVSTATEVTSKYVWFTTDIVNTLLEDFFNDFRPDENIPFATLRGIFKMSSTLSYAPDRWKEDSSDRLIMLKTGTVDDSEDFVIRNKQTGEGAYTLQFGFRTSLKDEKAKAEWFKNLLKECLTQFKGLKCDTSLQSEEDLSVYFIIPNFKFDIAIFKDLAVTDDIVRYFFTVDEHSSFKPRFTLFRTILTIPEKPELGIFNTDMKVQEMTPTDRYVIPFIMSPVDRDKVNNMQKYLLVKISGVPSKEAAKTAASIIKRVLGHYQEKQEEVRALYEGLGVKIVNPVDEVDEMYNSKAIINQFFVNQTRYFKPIAKPIPFSVLDEYEADWKDKNTGTINYRQPDGEIVSIPFLKFPLTAEGYYWSAYDFDADEKKWINPAYKFVGLKKNNMRNKATYDVLPMARKSEDSDIIELNKYLGLPPPAKKAVTKQQRVIEGRAFLEWNQYGELPGELSTLLNAVLDTDSKFYRRGTSSENSSLLECVLSIFDKQVQEGTTSESVRKVVEKERGKLPLPDALAMQSNYNETLEQIKKLANNSDVYMAPEVFMTYLSKVFELNIFGIRRNEDLTIEFIQPRHQWALYNQDMMYDTGIIVYEHFGGPTDIGRRCELIVETEKIHKPFDKVQCTSFAKTAKKAIVYKSLDLQNNLQEVSHTNFCELLGDDVEAQYIDSSGKQRGILLDENITVLVPPSPICPDVPTVSHIDLVEAVNKNVSEVVMERFGLQVDSGVFRAAGTKFEYRSSSCVKPLSNVELYKAQKRLSQYYKVLCLWAYSNHIEQTVPDVVRKLEGQYVQGSVINKTNASTYINFESALKWADDRIVIDEGVKDYIITSCSLSKRSPVWNGSKIFVQDAKTQEGLVYYLALMVHRRPDHVWKMRKEVWARDVYQSFSDFQQQPQTIMGDARSSFPIATNDFQLYNDIVPGRDSYLRNVLVEKGKVCKVVHARSKNHALALANVYVRRGAIVPDIADMYRTDAYKIYLYNSPTSITERLTAVKERLPIILAYRDGRSLQYAAIIPVVGGL